MTVLDRIRKPNSDEQAAAGSVVGTYGELTAEHLKTIITVDDPETGNRFVGTLRSVEHRSSALKNGPETQLILDVPSKLANDVTIFIRIPSTLSMALPSGA